MESVNFLINIRYFLFYQILFLVLVKRRRPGRVDWAGVLLRGGWWWMYSLKVTQVVWRKEGSKGMQISTQPGSGSSGTGQQGDTEPSSKLEFLYFDINKVSKAKIRPITCYCIYHNIAWHYYKQTLRQLSPTECNRDGFFQGFLAAC